MAKWESSTHIFSSETASWNGAKKHRKTRTGSAGQRKASAIIQTHKASTDDTLHCESTASQ